MMNLSKSDVQTKFEAAFPGIKIDKLTPAQVRFFADIGRHMRGRCRSNKAMVNFLNEVFPSVRAKMVPSATPNYKGEEFDVLDIQPRELSKS